MNWLSSTADMLMARLIASSPASWPVSLRYGLALVLVVIASSLKLILPLANAPFLLFMPIMFVIGFGLGKGPGLFATIFSTVAAECISLHQTGARIFAANQLLGVVLYFVICTSLVMVSDLLRRLLSTREAELGATRAANQALLESRAQQNLLNHELAHRLKNMLAMVQAIANQTMRRANSLQDARIAFEARLIALGNAQDLLTRTHWESAEFGAIVRNALMPHGIDAGRYTLGGPMFQLSSRCCLALSLALHELATNAAKYGALSVDNGHVDVRWAIETDPDETLMLNLVWNETGGPAVVTPVRTSFGSIMIARTLSGYFRGDARIEYPENGVRFSLRAPATASETDFSRGVAEILLIK